MPKADNQRFSPNRAGASYPLRPHEMLQARSSLKGPSGAWGRLLVRVTRDAQRERAEYWFAPDHQFSSAVENLSPEAMKALSDALLDLTVAAEGYAPNIDASDSGRSILFWKGEQSSQVFIPSHPASYAPSSQCVLAFDRLWSIVTQQP
jgi:hypothetical protein